jgi:hypothetical protein
MRRLSTGQILLIVAEWFLGRKKAGYEWPQMACLYPEHWIGEYR